MKHLNRKTIAIAAAMVSIALTTTAIAKSTPEEKAIEYRQGAFTMIGHHFGQMAAMVKGEVEFDAAAFKQNAEAVAALSKFPINGFIAGSYEGETEAKPEIADNMDDFKSKLETFQIEAVKLAEAAAGASDLAGLKPAFGATAESCKACHKAYREKK